MAFSLQFSPGRDRFGCRHCPSRVWRIRSASTSRIWKVARWVTRQGELFSAAELARFWAETDEAGNEKKENATRKRGRVTRPEMSRPETRGRDLRLDIVFVFALAIACYLAWTLRAVLLLLYVSALAAVVLTP